MVTITRQILISAPRDSVRLYLQDISKARDYEPKIKELEFAPAEGGFVRVAGKFMGLPWRGSFKVELAKDGGYRAEMVSGSMPRMSCAYRLRPVAGGTILTHEEHYRFSFILRPIGPFLERWIGRTMERELGVIKEEAERVHRRLQLELIEAAL